jgi:hypothetical protein
MVGARVIEAVDFEKCHNVDVTIWYSDSKNLKKKPYNHFLA